MSYKMQTYSKNTYTLTNYGLTIYLYIYGGTFTVRITGTTTEELSTSSGLVDIVDLSDYISLNHSFLTRMLITQYIMGQLQISSSSILQIGYTRMISDSSTTTLASGTTINIIQTYVM